ncbi:MAG: hypothetical protein N4A49_15485 [Marinifilaceae bacterium]|jgi:tetratricopeptide (TPR) repeat protein|nr:hypothetical protein [Marinifilaceae bacterium]
MKRLKVLAISCLSLAIFILAGCGGISKMQKEISKVNWQVTPEVLEAHAGMVEITIKANIPEKFFHKSVIVTATPVLKYEGGETAFPSKVFQGEKVQGNNTVVPFETGKTITYTGKIKYEEAMRVSTLEMRLVAQKGDDAENKIEFDPIKIADGVISTSKLLANTPKNIIGKDKFQRIIPESKESQLMYLINSSNIRWSEMKGEEMKALKAFLTEVKNDENKEFKGVEVSSYASPDGKEDLNEKLSQKREKSSEKYIKREMKRNKMKEFATDENVKTKTVPEDWAGFKSLLEASNISDKDLILRVLSMYTDPEVREKEIKNISAAFDELKKEILPKLRRSKFTVNIENIGKTDDQLRELALTNPSELNVEELLYAATLHKEISNVEKIYTTATTQFPQDWRGFNDLGLVQFSNNKTAEAKANFEKADKLSANNAIVKNNLAAVELALNKYDEAEVLLGAATGAGEEVNYNLGMVAMAKADYENAVKYFGSSNDVNAALANIMIKNYDEATKKLDANTTGNAMVYYLKAIVAARNDNADAVFSNLEKAVEKDSNLKAKIKTDIEFAKVMEDAKFKAIVQ